MSVLRGQSVLFHVQVCGKLCHELTVVVPALC